MSIGPKPDLLNYERDHYEMWKQDTLVWCAEAMQDAADRIERALTPPPARPEPNWIRKLVLLVRQVTT
jgi:broad specificity phosphatase PhoE